MKGGGLQRNPFHNRVLAWGIAIDAVIKAGNLKRIEVGQDCHYCLSAFACFPESLAYKNLRNAHIVVQKRGKE